MPRLKKYREIYDNQDSNSKLLLTNGQVQLSLSISGRKKLRSDDSSGQSQSKQSEGSQSGSKSDSKSQDYHIRNAINKQKNLETTLHAKKTQRKSAPKKISKYNADEILKNLQQELADAEDEEKEYDQEETSIDIPDDALADGKKKRSAKQKGMKFKSKFFSFDLSENLEEREAFQERVVGEEQQLQLDKLESEHRLIIEERRRKADEIMDQRKAQLEGKINRLKERMEFKNAHDDIRYKQHMKKTLQLVKDCQEVRLTIDAPKIFKGASAKHTDGALYIKNIAKSSQSHNKSQEEDISNAEINLQKKSPKEKPKPGHMNRKQFYDEVNKLCKQSKIVEIPAEANLFKKTSLEEINFDENMFKDNSMSRNSLSRSQAPSIARKSSELSRKSSGSDSQQSKSRSKRGSSPKDASVARPKSKPIQIVVEKQQQSGSVEVKPVLAKQTESMIEITQDKPEINTKIQDKPAPNLKKPKPKQKPPKQPKKKNKKKDKISQLFQQQAEASDDQEGEEGQSSEQDDNQSLQSMIDRQQLVHNMENQKQARIKFINEMIKKQQEEINRIKERILKPQKIKCEESSQSRERRRKRTQEVRRKIQQEQAEAETGLDDTNYENSGGNADCNPNQEQNQQFERQLKILQSQIYTKQQSEADSRQPPHKIAGIFGKNPKTIFKQIKIVARAAPQGPRGGFVNNSKAITGARAQVKAKGKSKDKNINF